MANPKAPDLLIIKRIAQDNLIIQLESIPGKKDLVIDEELMKPLDLIGGVTLLRKHGVDKIFKLETSVIDNGCDKRIYIIRPYMSKIKLVSEQVLNDKLKGCSREYRVVFTPRRLATCDMMLEQEGIYGDVTIDEYPLDLIALDQDVLSIEMPYFCRDFYLYGDQSWIHTVSRALCTIQSTFGSIPHVVGLGKGSKMVHELTKLMIAEEREYVPIGGPDIGQIILIDRDVDFVTPLLSQLVYEGIVADTFGIKSGFAEFGPEITGKKETVRILLNSDDKIFDEIRGLHFTSVFPLLSGQAKKLQSGYDKKDQMDIQQLKVFVSQDLRDLKQQHKSLALHIGACESILKKKTLDGFERTLHTEQSLLDETEAKENSDFIEECINKQLPTLNVLRLVCLLSLTKGAVDVKLLKSLKLQFLQSYNYEHLITFNNLKKVGLFADGVERRSNFQRVRKRMNLIPRDPNTIDTKYPKDMAYVFGGAYSPLSIKLIDQVLGKGYSTIEDVMKTLNIESFEDKRPRSARETSSTTQASKDARKVILVVFLGGCTHTEINALRFLSRLDGYKFLVVTTGIINGNSLLQTFLPG